MQILKIYLLIIVESIRYGEKGSQEKSTAFFCALRACLRLQTVDFS